MSYTCYKFHIYECHPFKVVGEVTKWQRHSPEQVKVMKEGLAKLAEQGIEAIED